MRDDGGGGRRRGRMVSGWDYDEDDGREGV